jgi:acid phosphatase
MGQFGQRDTAAAMGEWADAVDASFIVSTGDNFYQTGVEGSADPQWQTSWRDVYTHPGLATRKWHVVAGNHDYLASYAGLMSQLRWKGDARWSFPSLNYSLPSLPLPTSKGGSDRACVRLVFTDTCPFISSYRRPSSGAYPVSDHNMWANVNRSDPGAQLAWLRDELIAARAACDAVIVVGHHPVFSADGDHGDSADLIAAFKPLFDELGVDAYLAGHDHSMMHLEDGAVVYVITGAGSQVWGGSLAPTPRTVWLAATPGFTIHSINATHALHSFISSSTGSVVHQVLKPLRATSRA